jgi:DNA polymerase III subunit gamma/tau
MENFVVSARKYRPSTFDTVVGQSHITTTLKNAIANQHLAQAFLFCGPRGVGKTTCARILAKTINCQNLTPEVEACDKCESCVSFNQSSSFNIHELDAASNNSVEDIRNLVDQVRYAPQSGKYKIYIIDEVHMLSNAAFNAFLKTLEEPPSYAIFILATTEKHKIIPTILSRCQIFDFNRIQVQDITNHLSSIATKESIEAEREALALIAQKADGGLRDALSIFDLISTFASGQGITYKQVIENLHILDYDYYFRVTDALLGERMPEVLLIFDEILRKGFDGHNFVVGLCEHFRNLLVCKDNQTIQLLQVSETVMQKYKEQANSASLSFLMTALNIGSQCDIQYKNSKNQRLLVELALMKMSYIRAAVSSAHLGGGAANGQPAGSIAGVEKKKPDGVAAPSPAAPLYSTAEVTATAVSESTPLASPVKAVAIPNIPLPAAPPAGKPSKLRSTISIPSSLNEVKVHATSDKVEEEEAEEEEEYMDLPPDMPFSLADLKREWSVLVEDRKVTDVRYISLANRDLELNGTTFILRLDNVIQLEQLRDAQKEILTYLRSRLKNRSINMEVELLKLEDVAKTYFTPVEKFEILAQKYPLVRELKNRFHMQIEY